MTITLLATATSFWLIGTGDKPVSAESVGAVAPTARQPVVPGAGTAYLGAFVDPDGTALTSSDPTGGTASLPAELSALPAFNQQVGRPPWILSTFQDWGEPLEVPGLDSVAATGAIPMVTWECGDTDANVVDGLDDAMVTTEARSLAATNVPILFRWFPDPNLSDDPAASACLGANGPSGYIAAYQHIHGLFEAAGATNVAFVWSVDTSAEADPNVSAYYPGGDVVDWLGADGNATPSGDTQASAFSSEFGSWYGTFSTADKPMMVSSTGADAGSQSPYLGQIPADLPGQYPQIKALVYFDAPEAASGDQYQLDAAGAAAFGQLAASPYFNPNRSPTAATLTSSKSSAPIGARLTLTASVDATDNSGSVSFVDNGTPIPGCVFIPITTPARCVTSQLAGGSQTIVATYSGDSAFSPSSSAPVIVLVTATPPTTRTPTDQSMTPPPPSSSEPGVLPSSAYLSPNEAQAQLQGPPIPGSGQAYLGAFVDPTGQALSVPNPTGGALSIPIELANVPSFNSGLGRPLSIASVYLNWTNSALVTQIDQVWALGAIPMITWNCGDSDSNVASGKDDALISAVAQKLAATHIPIFLRWYPDPNDLHSASAQSCLLNVPRSSNPATVYKAAYAHIHDEFVAAGASNVSFVWSVDTSQDQGSAAWDDYYPGASFVDWIGADNSYNPSTPAHDPFRSAFQQWYNQYSDSGKPLIVSSFAAIRGTQVQYLQDLSNDLPTVFPLIKGLVYFDAPDRGNAVQYELNSNGTSSLDALSQLSNLQPTRQQSSVSVTATPNAVDDSGVVEITASLAPTDLGGSLNFTANGVTIPGCGAVPVLQASSCETSSLPLGQDLISVSYDGDAQFAPAASPPVSVSVTPGVRASGPPAIPGPNSAYLGAYVRPYPLKSSTFSTTPVGQEVHLLPTFNASLSRPLSVVHIYQPWTTPIPDAQIQEVRASGAIPMIDWACGDTDANVISGADDALISGFARRLAQLNEPLFLRWYWEPNFPNGANYASCISNLGPQGYVEAFRHIHDLFMAAGATNVAFVWTIGASGPDHDWMEYYPGPSYVDWMAADGYVRTSAPTSGVFTQRFARWYQTFAGFGKPLMISETAAFSGAQQAYLNEIASEVPSQYPLLKGVLYFDALGNLPGYPLDVGGMRSFRSLSAIPFFQPNRTPSSTLVAATPNAAVTGQTVTLTANVQATDNGGTISFLDKGTPVAGCQSIALDVSSSCTSTDLAMGQNTITAVYSGDAYNAGSNAGAASASIVPMVFPDTSGFVGSSDLSPVGALSFGLWPNAGQPLSEPTRAPPSAAGTKFDLFSLFGGAVLGERGFGGDALVIGTGLLLLCGLYIAGTWTQDQRRRRRKTIAMTVNESATDGNSATSGKDAR